MPRKQLSEFRAKTILNTALDGAYEGVPIHINRKDWGKQIVALTSDQRYVVKVDQATKGRFKKGLVKLDRTMDQLFTDIAEMGEKGYEHFIIEPFTKHDASSERYLALARSGIGIEMSASPRGGIDVEANPDLMRHWVYGKDTIPEGLEIGDEELSQLTRVFDENYFSFLEINPLVVDGKGKLSILDAAVEVDDAAEFFVRGRWGGDDLRNYSSKSFTIEEQTVRELNEQSQASFNLEVLNPDGNLFLLLSGGGASVVVADEVKNLGYGDQLANYGEYSGGPNREETELYTAQLISLLLRSTAVDKRLIIAGGVANFTDVKTTFAGVIDALRKQESELRKQGVKVYVRRGGPNEIQGLALMKEYLEGAGILGAVHGPELVLADIVREAVEGVTA